MKNKYETPSIEIITYDFEIQTEGPSIVLNYPWNDSDDSGYFE